MIGLLQRVARASVEVEGQTVASIGRGLLVFVGVRAGDGEAQLQRLLERLLGYRMFPDGEGRMNRSLHDIGGELLLVPQFTLAADTRKGMRPSFTGAATPADARALFHQLVTLAKERHAPVASGVFGADMKVSLVNDGPVTFWLEA